MLRYSFSFPSRRKKTRLLSDTPPISLALRSLFSPRALFKVMLFVGLCSLRVALGMRRRTPELLRMAVMDRWALRVDELLRAWPMTSSTQASLSGLMVCCFDRGLGPAKPSGVE